MINVCSATEKTFKKEQVRIQRDSSFFSLFEKFQTHSRLFYEGADVSFNETPESLDMNDGDTIDVFTKIA